MSIREKIRERFPLLGNVRGRLQQKFPRIFGQLASYRERERKSGGRSF